MYSFSFPIINHKKTVRNCQTRKKKSALILDPPPFIEIEYSPISFRSLLYGPPGLGKTTLAHVVANHAGYNVVEINASDDREYSEQNYLPM
jgi:SpoVK/Ycf46/Vps4 family AAA+-type ATPase